MKKINNKYLLSIFIVLIVFTTVLLVNVFLFSKILKISQNFINEKKLLEETNLKLNQLKIIEDRIDIDNDLNEIYDFFNESDKPIDNIVFLKEIAEKNNVVIDVSFNESEKEEEKKEEKNIKNEWTYLNFKVNATADNFLSLVNFLEEIELRKKITEIDKLKIEKIVQKSSRAESDDIYQIKAEISIKFYFLEK